METHGKPWKSHGKPMFSQKNDLLMVGFPHLFICLEDRYAQITNLFMKKCGRITIVIIPPVMWKKSVLRVMKNGDHNQQWGINESCMLFENKGKCHIPTSLSFCGPLSSQLPWASQLIRLSQVLVPDFAERVSVSQGHPGERSVCCLEPI